MDSIISTKNVDDIISFISLAKNDPNIEVECKLLAGKIRIKDTADRILGALQTLAIGVKSDEHRLTISYNDGVRVVVEGFQNIYDVCVKNSFKGIPLDVEKKQKHTNENKQSEIEIPEASARVTLRTEQKLRKDWEADPSDPKGYIRIINRKSFCTANDLFRIDFSMVKTRPSNYKQKIKDVLKQQHTYELEIEFNNKKTTTDNAFIAKELVKLILQVSQAYYQTPFLLSVSDIHRYQQEFSMTTNTFLNPVTLVRRHLNAETPHNILKGYTVTTKADGSRAGLYVTRDRKVVMVTTELEIMWTGVTATDDSHAGDFIDGEFIDQHHHFYIFDVHRFRGRDTRVLPLMTTDDDTIKNPLNSRLGCARLFVDDMRTKFRMTPSSTQFRIETKPFLAGDGPVMEECIQKLLSMKFEYETDGLVFTPRNSSISADDRRGKTWLRTYKWKPPHLNTIDFLIKLPHEESFDPTTKLKVKKGELYVSRTPKDDIIYPRETMTGEYVAPKLSPDMQKVADSNTRIPSLFQPTVPREPDAYQIMVELNGKNIPVDSRKNRVDDNTIVECAYDVETHRWSILRTRYDKTYQYQVLRKPQYGNDIMTANSIWTSIHVPITENMIKTFATSPPDSTYEDDMYYKDDLKRCSRIFSDVYDFHNRIKDELYKQNIKKDDTLLELGVGRAGDLNKWKRTKPSKVVGIDISLSNITSPTQGSAVRYIVDRKKHPHDFIPPCLFIEGDMTTFPLLDQEDKYMAILTKKESAPTEYLSKFEGLDSFDVVSCQFAMHYACESEEVFRAFAKNLEKYGKGIFFGTCSDGKAVYSLLHGKSSFVFGNEKQVCGEYKKEYEDKETWAEEFGMPVTVMLESFDKSAKEYIVPFEKITEILAEHGYELVETKLFSEIYSEQRTITLTPEQQTFSFLNRTFVFKRTKVHKPKEDEEEKPKLRKLRKPEEEKEKEVVLFHGADASKGEYRNFSNMSEHKIEIEGVEYQTVEHYFQAAKAKEFEKDDELYEKILKAKTPKAVKALGKHVKNFDKETWDSKKDDIMKQGIRTKFVQHPELRKQLLETGDKQIGYADPRNTYWGIGTSQTSEKSKFSSKWRGQNRIGKILMDLRTEFMDDSSK